MALPSVVIPAEPGDKPAEPVAPRSTATPPVVMTAEEREFVERVNAARADQHASVLTIDPLLVRVARDHSREMYERHYFDHESPTAGLESPMDRYLAGLHQDGIPPPPYILVGENLFYCSSSTNGYSVAYAHHAFMSSEGHRENILEPRFAKIGVGVYRDERGEVWVTEVFLRDRE
jgi:uncharacterized protein YkwD